LISVSIVPYGNRYYSNNLFCGTHEGKSFRLSNLRTVFHSIHSRNIKNFSGVALIVDLPKPATATIIATNHVNKLITKLDFQGVRRGDEFAEFEAIDKFGTSSELKFFSNNKQLATPLITAEFLGAISKISRRLEQMRNDHAVKTIFAVKWLFAHPQNSSLFRMEIQARQLMILFAVPLYDLFELNHGLLPTYDLEAATARVARQLAVMREIIAETDALY